MHGELLRPQSPHGLLVNELTASLRIQKNYFMGLLLLRWVWSVKVRFVGSG